MFDKSIIDSFFEAEEAISKILLELEERIQAPVDVSIQKFDDERQVVLSVNISLAIPVENAPTLKRIK